MLVPRDLLEEINIFLKRREFIAIIGPRQAGKTTVLEMLRDYLCKGLRVDKDLIQTATFEDRRLLAQFEADPVAFVKSYFPPLSDKVAYLMIDEFQYADNGGQKLKLIYDTIKGIKIIITGSSSLDIKAQVGKFLVGRILTFHLYPFNFGEVLRGKETRLERIYREGNREISAWLLEDKRTCEKRGKDIFAQEMINRYEEFCLWGGYPAVVLSQTDKERQKILADIYNNYILKDIKGLLELATDTNLFSLSQYLATQAGNLLTYQNLGQASNLDYRQLKRHLNILKETMICQEVKPFFRNRQKELTKNPKIFFIDMGFRNNLMENMNTFDKRSDTGAIVENAVFIRLNELSKGAGKINFYRTKAGAEVDFIFQIKGDIVPIEVKFSKMTEEKVSRSFMSFINSFEPLRGIILTRDYWGRKQQGKTEILFAPVYYL
ncbi:MAG: AAA family ATPase [bacterium]|nr:AAA family ATPase [bacterium]